jgi:acetyl esterase
VSNSLQITAGPSILGLLGLLLSKLRQNSFEPIEPTHPAECYMPSGEGHAEQFADVYLPKSSGPYPSVILVHGGGGVLGHLRSPSIAFVATRLVNVGYAVVSIDYRRLFHQGTMKDSIQDLEQAINWWFDRIQKYSLDAQRVAILGFGNGGTLSLLSGQRNGNRLCRIISLYGHYDWKSPRGILAELMRRFVLGTSDPADYSPLFQLDEVMTPITLIHGAKDRLSPLAYVQAFAARREGLGLPTDLHTYSALGHGFLENPSHPQSLSAVEEVLAALHTHRGALDRTGPSRFDGPTDRL